MGFFRKCGSLGIAFIGLAAFAGLTYGVAEAGAQSGQFDAAQLKSAIEGLGYETKALNTEAGKEKYEFKLTRGGLDVPIAAEISPSKNFIWLTVFLGEPKADKALELLKQNGKIQPTNFYVTDKGSLMLGFAIDNRSMTAAILRQRIDKLTDDTVKTRSYWE
jgi:hypothetical protein